MIPDTPRVNPQPQIAQTYRTSIWIFDDIVRKRFPISRLNLLTLIAQQTRTKVDGARAELIRKLRMDIPWIERQVSGQLLVRRRKIRNAISRPIEFADQDSTDPIPRVGDNQGLIEGDTVCLRCTCIRT